MTLPRLAKLSFACIALTVFVGVSNAQEKKIETKSETPETIRVTLKDGSLSGFVFQNVQDKQKATVAKVSLAADGKMVDSQLTSKDGTFTFTNVKPGVYTVIGVAGGMVGNQVVDAGAYDGTFTQMPLEVAGGFDSGMAYDTYGDMPVQAFAGDVPVDAYGGCTGCGASYGGASCGGSCYGGGGRGGLRRLLPLVGLVGLAGLSNNDDPASPDN